MLTHPGIPCVFGPHAWGSAFGNDEDAFARVEKSDERGESAEGSDSEGPGSLGDVISRLLALRAKHEIRADAHVKILAAESDLYVARVAHRLTVKLGPRYDVPAAIAPREPEWRLALSGDDWAVWERARSYEGGEPRGYARKTTNALFEEDDGAAAEAVRRVCGAVRATDEDALLFDAAAPVLVGGALDEAADPASVGSFFEAPTSGFVKPAASGTRRTTSRTLVILTRGEKRLTEKRRDDERLKDFRRERKETAFLVRDDSLLNDVHTTYG